jgi:hypothetical protein
MKDYLVRGVRIEAGSWKWGEGSKNREKRNKK